MANRKRDAGREAQAKGWWQSHKWLVFRRTSQLLVLAMFLSGPWFGCGFYMVTTAVAYC